MNIKEFIEGLASKDIVIWKEGEALKYRAPKGVMDMSTLNKIKENKQLLLEYLQGKDEFCKNSKSRHEKFPLTDIQNSYLMGRNKMYELGGVACHGYIEIEFDEILDKDRIEYAWNKVIQKHDMLRAIISESGYQIIQEAVSYINIQYIDLRNEFETRDNERKILREELSNKQYKLGQWPMCDLAVSIENDKSIIHFSMDMLVSDFISMNIILNDLKEFYDNPEMIIIPTTQYRDIVLHREKMKKVESKDRKEAEIYWNNKLSEMGEAPELPIMNTINLEESGFSQKKTFLNSDLWNKFKGCCMENNITPSVLIMAALAEVVSVWSSNDKFCINTTLLNRPNIVSDINKIVGDFTEVNVSSINLDFSKKFIERIKEMQRNLWLDLEHNAVSGVEVLRKLGKHRQKNIIIPIVFTSTLGVTDKDTVTSRKRIVNKLSQTPQVYIDCQAAEENGGLTVNWDIRDGVFNEFIIDEMFQSFEGLIKNIPLNSQTVFEETYPIKLSNKTIKVRDEINNTSKEFKGKMMEEGFLSSLKKYPNKTALITKDGEYTYSNLSKYVKSVMNELKRENLKPGDKVGVDIEKNVWQVASIIAILLMKGTYIPIDVNQPIVRKKKIVNKAEINLIISDNDNLKEYCQVININSIKLSNDKLEDYEVEEDYSRPAYVIFTSGTTGEPKGVIITHEAAMNTICDVNERYNLTENDVLLGLSNISFDLSVYDIFGAFELGATLVLPDSDKIKDPKYLYELILVHKISIWNSVPAQMQMLVNYLESVTIDTNISSLKRVLLSGDWIPVNLPKRILNIFPESKVVSMGGATEASIWSILYDISKDEVFNKSVPYGKPMVNQKFYILNKHMECCPNYVDGSLYIAGRGLSLGYLNDDEENNNKYSIFEKTGERIYKTGDRGCYREDGIIIFKGRDIGDEQVKLHGHRVELSEIRSVLEEHPDIDSAVTVAMGESPEDLHINAVVSPVRKNMKKEVKEYTEERNMLNILEQQYEDSVDSNLLEEWIKKSDEVVVGDIYNVFSKYGFFTDEDTSCTFNEITSKMNIPEKLHKLTKRWINVLEKEGIIQLKDNQYYLAKDVKKRLDCKILWEEFYDIESKFNYSKAFVDYLKESSDLLPELIQGKENPLDILFPKGEVQPAMAAYHDNKINKILNDIAVKETEYLCKKQNKVDNSKTFRILEVGAGVGGTSIDVIPKLVGYNVEYYFSDLSNFFLNKAQENFKEYNWVKYGIFDINEDFALQGHEAFSFDLILCGNVLHNSKDIHLVMENLKGLLKEQGSIIVLEETRTSYMLLTSMEFKDGLTGFMDERREEEQTFFTRGQWENIFEKHNGEIVYEFPNKESKLDLVGQTIYITRFSSEYENISKDDIRSYLEHTISSYMIPSNIVVLPSIPLTNNRKVDIKKVNLIFDKIGQSKNNAKKYSELPKSDLEKRIENIWCKELNIKNIGRNDNFYKVGGDSLLIAQVIGQMLDQIPETDGWEWSTLLTEMMQTPTIREISEKIYKFQNNKEDWVDPSLIKIKNSKLSNDKSVAKVLFHAGTGTLTPYDKLLSYMEEDSKDDESIIGFTFGNDAEYISIETGKTFNVLGEKYGKILKNLGYSKYILIGHCVGGLIALETAQYLTDNSMNVVDVTLISTGIPRRKDKTILRGMTDEIYKKTLKSSLDNELLLERIFAKMINADEYKAGYVTSDERLQKYIEYMSKKGVGDITVEALCKSEGEFDDVVQEFRRQSSKPISQRLNDLYNTIEKTDGEIMEQQLKMLNVLFRIFSQNFRCVASYEPKPYFGNIRVFCCSIKGGHFYPGFFEEDYETWKPYIKGQMKYDIIKGQHFDCITEPNLGENIKKILKFNY